MRIKVAHYIVTETAMLCENNSVIYGFNNNAIIYGLTKLVFDWNKQITIVFCIKDIWISFMLYRKEKKM